MGNETGFPMTEYQKTYSAFIESVCQKVGCPEAVETLQNGFKAFCESYDPASIAERNRVIGQLRNNIKVTSPTGVVRPNVAPSGEKEHKTTVIGATKPMTRDDIAMQVDAEHPEFTNENGNVNLDSYGNRQQLIAQRQCEQFQKHNEDIARQNAAKIARYPFYQIKQMFPDAYCKVQGEVWVRKFLKKGKDPKTGETKVIGAVGSWEPDIDPMRYANPTMAVDAAKRKYTKGHWEIYTVIPELQASIPNVIDSDR